MTSLVAASFVVLNSVAVVVCVAALVVFGIVVAVGRRRQLRLEFDRRLASTVAQSYWPIEPEIFAVLRCIGAMQSTTLFGDVSALDVLAYKFRRRRGWRWRKCTAMATSKSAATTLPLTDAMTETHCNDNDGKEVGLCLHSEDEYEPISGLSRAPAPHLSAVSTDTCRQSTNVLRILDKIDHMFDLLYLRLRLDKPGSRCPPEVVTGPFARTIRGIAQATAALWPDGRAPAVRQIVAYFGGGCSETEKTTGWRRRIRSRQRSCRTSSTAVAAFDAARTRCGGSDEAVEWRIRSRLPYVDALRLSGSRFVLAEVRPSSTVGGDMSCQSSSATQCMECRDGGTSDVSAKVRFVDERLSRLRTKPRGGGARTLVRRRWPEMVAAYREAVDLAVAAELVTSRTVASHFPEFSVVSPPSLMIDETSNASAATARSKSAAAVDPENVIVLVRHLLRLMCGNPDAFHRLESDPRFVEFVSRLHDAMYGWSEAPSALRSAVDRCRANVVAYARKLTAIAGRVPVDDGSLLRTRRTIELAESQLYRHIDGLTRRRVQLAKESRRRQRRRHRHRGPEHGDFTEVDDDEDDYFSAIAGDDVDSETLRRPRLQFAFDRWLPLAEPKASSSVESESSLYTLAASNLASPPRRVTPSPTPGAHFNSNRSTEFRQYGNVACTADGGSILSSGSTTSPYASVSSVARSSGGSRLQSPSARTPRRHVDASGVQPVVGSPASSTGRGICGFEATKLAAAAAAAAAVTSVESPIGSDEEFFDTPV